MKLSNSPIGQSHRSPSTATQSTN